MRRIVTIQDISCLGKCSATVALPVLSALGLETSLLPTAVLSAHTMFSAPVIRSLDDMIEPIMEHWKREGAAFDTVYSGYLSSKEEIRKVKNFFDVFADGDTLKFVDPAMADHGRLYSGFEDDFPAAMAALCAQADIIVPNLTEACLMTGVPYCEEPDSEQIRELLLALAELGTGKAVIITGAVSPEDREFKDGGIVSLTGASGLNVETGEFFEVRKEKIPVSFHGTGDLFASVAAGALTRQMPLQDALQLAADFVHAALRETVENDPDKDKRFGVDFEPVLSILTDAVRTV